MLEAKHDSSKDGGKNSLGVNVKLGRSGFPYTGKMLDISKVFL